MKNYFITATLLLAVSSILSQKQNFKTNYELSECVGKVPNRFNQTVMELTDYSSSQDNSNFWVKNGFYHTSYFNLLNLMHSGKVLFGDEMTVYVNEVLNNLLKKNKKKVTKNTYRVHVLKTNKFQCFSYFEGSIFVSVGLLAKIDNEAQLAFALAREVVAIEKSHDPMLWKENREYVSTPGQFWSIESFYSAINSNAQKKIYQQDYLGLNMCKVAGYGSKEAESYLKKEMYSYVSFGNEKFNKEFFNRSSYTVPSKYFGVQSKSLKQPWFSVSILINSSDTVSYSNLKLPNTNKKSRIEKIKLKGLDLSNATSSSEPIFANVSLDEYDPIPSIKIRIKELKKIKKNSLLGNYSTSVNCLLPKEKFVYIQDMARFENQFLHLTNKNFVLAVYENYLLKKKFPNNVFLDECLAMGVYGLSKFKLNKLSADEMYLLDEEGDEQIKGQAKAITELYDNCSRKELNILATKIILEQQNQEKFKPYLEDLMKDLTMDLEFDYRDFITSPMITVDTIAGKDGKDSLILANNSFVKLSEADYDKLSKLKKITYSKEKNIFDSQMEELEKLSTGKQKSTSKQSKLKYYLYAFKTELQDTGFYNRYKRYYESDEYRYFDDWFNSLTSDQQYQYNKNKKKRNKAFRNYSLDSLLVMNPKYFLVGAKPTERNSLEYVKMEQYKERLVNSANRNLQLNGITSMNLASYNTTSFNSTVSVNRAFNIAEWQTEIETSFDYHMVPFTQFKIDKICEETGFKNFLFYGVNTTGDKAYLFMRITDQNGYNDMYKYKYGNKKGNPTKDNKFITKTFKQIGESVSK